MADVPMNGVVQHLRKLVAAEGASDRELLDRFVTRRDEAAFAALVERHGATVFGVCRRVLPHVHDAEDACQAAFLVLARKVGSVRKQESLACWLHGVAYHVATNLKRGLARRSRREPNLPEQPTPAVPAADLSWGEVRAALDEELRRLPERFRTPLILCYLDGLTRDEAANRLGWSVATLRGRLERARKLLHVRLTRRGIALSATLLAGALAKDAAAMPATLVVTTVRAALGASGGVSAEVAALVDVTVSAMTATRGKIAAALLVVAGVLAFGIGKGAIDWTGAAAPVREPAAELQPVAGVAAAKEDAPRPAECELKGHQERVTGVAFSADGRWIASAGWDGTVRLWDTRTGKEEYHLDVPPTKNYNPASLCRVLFTPDGEKVIAAQQAMPNEPGVIVWDRRTGKRLHEFEAGRPGVALAPDGKLLACGGYGVIRLYDVGIGKTVRTIQTPLTHVEALAFLPDGKTLLSLGPLPRPQKGNLGRMPSTIRAWDVATGDERPSVLKGVQAGCMALSPDGRTLAHADGITVRLRETATGGERARLFGHANEVCSLAFTPDGRTLASGGMDGTVRLWDLPGGKEVGCLGKEVPAFEDGNWVLALAFAPDGRSLVSGSLHRTAYVRDVSRIAGRRAAPVERSADELAADWLALAGAAAAAQGALGRLVLSPERAVAFLAKRLESREPVDPKRIAQLIAEMDDDQFEVRERATRDLEALPEGAAPALRGAMATARGLEANRRIARLLDRLSGASPTPETLRLLRTVEVLEVIGSKEARRLLDQLAAAPADTWLREQARAAVARLAARGAP